MQMNWLALMMMMMSNLLPPIGTNRTRQLALRIRCSSYCSTYIWIILIRWGWGWGAYECWKRLRHLEQWKSLSGNPTSPHIQHTIEEIKFKTYTDKINMRRREEERKKEEKYNVHTHTGEEINITQVIQSRCAHHSCHLLTFYGTIAFFIP
ncbi:hypothetical protein ACJIZ3_016240 [Penstemon smallii]|uniref:Secreted protein n=1 Tax=Penstemon smallii TaxID=265156 RepID=A0ABD3RS67_9LAMI